MKDYLVSGDKEEFITNYEIKGKNIIIHYSKGKDLTVPYTQNNEEKILKNMESQINERIQEQEYADNSGSKLSKLHDKIGMKIFLTGLSAFGTLLFVGGCFGTTAVVCIPITAITALSTILNGKRMLNLLSQNKEVRKMQEFLESPEEINEKLHNNENILSGVSYKAKKYVKKLPDTTERIIDVNSIDNFSLADLRAIKLNIERSQGLSFEQQQTIDTEEKGQAKVLRPTKNTDRK